MSFKETKNYNLILLLVDGARIDRLKKSTNFSSILNKGTTFDQMITYGPYTLVSMHSIFSGMYGGRNGVDAYNKMPNKYNSNCKFLANYLSELGYSTWASPMRTSLIPETGFDIIQDFDEKSTDYSIAHSDFINRMNKSLKPSQNFFLYLHYPKIHTSIVENVFDKYDDFSDEYFSNLEQNKKLQEHAGTRRSMREFHPYVP